MRNVLDNCKPKGLTTPLQRVAASWLSSCLLFLTPAVSGAAVADDSKSDEILSAIVGVRAEVPITARTAAALGTERQGSGVVIDEDGLIVTIGYLILEASRVEVTLADSLTVPVNIVAYDHDTGFGLLRTVHPIDTTPMKLGKSADVEESTQLLISGYGGAAAAQPAIVVSRRVFAGYWEYLLENAIFTAPPYRNFGGAALVSTDGELMGVGSLIVGDAVQGQQQIPGNMFVPIDILKPILKDLITSGRAPGSSRPWLGVYTEEFRERLFVTRVADQGPAAKAGIETGDIIVAVDGQEVASMEDFYRRVWAQGDAGAQAALTVLRGSKLMNITVESGNRYEWLRLNPV